MGESLASASAGPRPEPAPPAGRRRRVGIRTAAGATALVLAAGGGALVALQVLQPGSGAELATLESADFRVAGGVPAADGEGWTAEVDGFLLRLRADHPGAMHPLWTTSPATDEMAVTATLSLPADGGDAEALYIGGVTVLGADGAGWGLACGTDGHAYVLAVWDGRSQALDAVADAGCDGDLVTLSLDVRRGGGGVDTLAARLPDGGRIVLKPGEGRGPFTGAGFVMASADSTLTVPGLDVQTYEVRISEESVPGDGS